MNELVKLAKEHLRNNQNIQHDWLAAWRELAELTYGITPEDPRLQPVLTALNVCDVAFVADDWTAFQEARKGIVRAMDGDEGGTHQHSKR